MIDIIDEFSVLALTYYHKIDYNKYHLILSMLFLLFNYNIR